MAARHAMARQLAAVPPIATPGKKIRAALHPLLFCFQGFHALSHVGGHQAMQQSAHRAAECESSQ
eukprot:1160749-Pelagomonas_calceolata.AAC.9